MTNKDFSHALGDIDTKYVDEAIDYKANKKRDTWHKWIGAVACFCVVAIFAFSLMNNSNVSKSKAPTVLMNGAEYTICGANAEAAILEACGLPTELSCELAGTFVSYLDYDGECYYTLTNDETNVILYEYKPEPNTNVFIAFVKDEYYAAIRRDQEGFHGINDILYRPGI